MRISAFIQKLFGHKAARASALSLVALVSWASGVSDVVPVSEGNFGIRAEFGVSEAFAEDKKELSKEAQGAQAAATFINGLHSVIQILFLPATMLAGWLLSPDWTFGEIFGLRVVFHDLWVLVSNVVYAIFAFILVGIAFMNIFGSGGEHYVIKKALPRFAVGILIVPFTWFVVSATLSVANILTASVLRLPASVVAPEDASKESFEMEKECTIYYDKLQAGAQGGKKSTPGEFWKCEGEKVSMSLNNILKSDKGAYGILNVYSFAIFKVQAHKDVKDVSSISSVVDLVIQLGVWVIFLFVYALLVFALVFALFTRAVYLWLIAIFSPLFGLFYFFDGHGGEATKDLEKKLGFKTFIGLAMVPVYVSAALAFGLLFLFKVSTTSLNPQASSFFQPGSVTAPDGKTAKFVMGWDGKEVSMNVTGVPIGQVAQGATSATGMAAQGAGLAASAIGKIIVDVLALIVLWMAVMAALKSNEITKQAVDPIAQFGSSIGGLIKDLPKHVPIPLPGGHSVSAKGLQNMGQQISQTISQRALGESTAIGQAIGGSLADKMGLKESASSKVLGAIERAAAGTYNTSNAQQNADQMRRIVHAAVNEWGQTPEQVMKDQNARKRLAEHMERIFNLKDNPHIKSMKEAPDATAFDFAFKHLADSPEGKKVGVHLIDNKPDGNEEGLVAIMQAWYKGKSEQQSASPQSAAPAPVSVTISGNNVTAPNGSTPITLDIEPWKKTEAEVTEMLEANGISKSQLSPIVAAIKEKNPNFFKSS